MVFLEITRLSKKSQSVKAVWNPPGAAWSVQQKERAKREVRNTQQWLAIPHIPKSAVTVSTGEGMGENYFLPDPALWGNGAYRDLAAECYMGIQSPGCVWDPGATQRAPLPRTCRCDCRCWRRLPVAGLAVPGRLGDEGKGRVIPRFVAALPDGCCCEHRVKPGWCRLEPEQNDRGVVQPFRHSWIKTATRHPEPETLSHSREQTSLISWEKDVKRNPTGYGEFFSQFCSIHRYRVQRN